MIFTVLKNLVLFIAMIIVFLIALIHFLIFDINIGDKLDKDLNSDKKMFYNKAILWLKKQSWFKNK